MAGPGFIILIVQCCSFLPSFLWLWLIFYQVWATLYLCHCCHLFQNRCCLPLQNYHCFRVLQSSVYIQAEVNTAWAHWCQVNRDIGQKTWEWVMSQGVLRPVTNCSGGMGMFLEWSSWWESQTLTDWLLHLLSVLVMLHSSLHMPAEGAVQRVWGKHPTYLLSICSIQKLGFPKKTKVEPEMFVVVEHNDLA